MAEPRRIPSLTRPDESKTPEFCHDESSSRFASKTPKPLAAPNSPWLNRLLAVTVFLGAWLLFQIQPIVAKRILPWFGGGAGVWTAAMLFFQTALFVGYLYAHLIARRLAPRAQVTLHGILLAASAMLLVVNPVLPSNAWKPVDGELPAWRILVMLSVCVGPAYVILAATAPLAQVWFGRANPGRSPYRLYALSNIGSLAALVSYPFVVEPYIGLARQGMAWSALFGMFAVMCAASGVASLYAAPATGEGVSDLEGAGQSAPASAYATTEKEGESMRPAWLKYALWLALPACASVALIAITNYLCQDVASFPLLWILPLVTYLLTFILSFDSDRWYRRGVWMPALGVTSYAAVYSWYQGSTLELHWQVIVHLMLLLSLGMVCHGELAAMRPGPRRLTAFYLCISGGGALGGALAGVVAPLVLPDRYEFQLAIIASWLLALLVVLTDRASMFYDGKAFMRLTVTAAFLGGLVWAMWYHASQELSGAFARARNFYGVLEIREYAAGTHDAHYQLNNGRISHGSQFRAAANRRFATQYYGVNTGIGQLLIMPPTMKPQRVGLIGLGVGTLAAYAESGAEYRFYDINPKVIELADQYFTYLKDARKRGAKITIIEGDARLSLEREPPQNFDVLAVDAFSGDAIPVHLLTLEAFELYLRHLRQPDGIIAVHISNLHLNLAVVVQAAADRYGLAARLVDCPPDDSTPSSHRSLWVLLQRPDGFLAKQPIGVPLAEAIGGRESVAWTDDYSNLLGIIEE